MANPRPVPPNLRVVDPIGLRERFENQFLLCERNADAGIANSDVKPQRILRSRLDLHPQDYFAVRR